MTTINYDCFGLAEPANIYLCKTDNSIICELNGIDLTTVQYTPQLNNYDTIQFDVHKYINGEESNGYDMLDEAMYLFVDGIGYFRMFYPQISNDGFDEYKSVTAQSCDCELALKTLKNFKVNCGSLDSLEYLADNNTKETDEGVKIATSSITLYNPGKPQLSLLHLALKQVSGWTIGCVDETVAMTEIEETSQDDFGNIVTETYTNPSKRSFDIDSKNVYAFLTQDVSQKFECIFEFDIMKRKINVYDINTYGQDSGVFISYRNLIQTLNYAPAQEDNITTRFDVRGADDLTIDAVNFGTSTIEDLSYYLNTRHMSQDLIDTYNKWLSDVANARKRYMYYNRQYSIIMEKRDEVNNRVPNDGLNNDWKQFTIDELDTIKKKYTGYMDALKKIDDYWDSENQKWLNKGAEQDYIAYQGILEIIDQTIKYKQASAVDTSKEEDNLDDLLEEWNTNWDLFGLTELKSKEKVYLQNIEALEKYKSEWKDLSSEDQVNGHLSEENYNISHNQYLKYLKYEYGSDENGNPYTEKEKGGCSLAIKERQEEYNSYQKQMDDFLEKMSELSKSVDKSNYFSDEDLDTLNKLYHDTDYTNDNILTTSIDSAEKIINTQYELFDDATIELSKVCQPQLSFTLSMDNIFAIPEFKEWQGNFKIGNFIHLAFDDNDQYFLKLRISSLTYNPCVIESDLQIEFTNMIDYSGGLNDLDALYETTVNSAKNQITNSVKSKLDTTGIEVSDSLIKALVNSSSFSGAISSGVFDTVSANVGTFGKVIAKTINAQQLMAEAGLFETVVGKDGKFFNVLALDVNMDRAQVGTLSVDRLIIRGGTNSLMYTFNDTLGKLDQTQISDKEYDQYFMNGKNIAAHTITADEILAHTITAKEITTDNIRGLNGWINLANGTFRFFNGFDKANENTDDELWANADAGLSWNGNELSVRGKIFATSGEIGSWIIEKTAISRGLGFNIANSEDQYNAYFGENGLSISNTFVVDPNGKLTATDADIVGKITATSGSFAGELKAATGTFSGELKAATGSFEGSVTATEGYLGGWKIANGGITYDSDEYTVYLLNGTNTNKDYLVVYDKVNKNWPFYVRATGYMGATKGNIAGWNFDDKAIYKGSGFNTANTSTVTNAYFGTSGLSLSNKFVVTQSGALTATDATLKSATIDGEITATSGKIGLFKISSDGSLYNKPYGTAGSGSNSCGLSVTSGKHAFWAGSGAFYVDMDGSMHCEKADISGAIRTESSNNFIELKDGMIFLGNITTDSNGAKVDNYRGYFGFNGDGAYLGFTNAYPTLSSCLNSNGLTGNVRNTKGEYKVPISSSTVEEYEIDTIRSVKNSGVKKIIVYGKFGALSKMPDDNSAVAFSSSESDSRLKKNISDTKVSNALEQILSIKHREFDWKDDNFHNDIGYVAQELEKINPRMVFKPENKNEMYSVNTFYMTGLITKSIQEMYAELKAENAALKKRIQVLENQTI